MDNDIKEKEITKEGRVEPSSSSSYQNITTTMNNNNNKE